MTINKIIAFAYDSIGLMQMLFMTTIMINDILLIDTVHNTEHPVQYRIICNALPS